MRSIIRLRRPVVLLDPLVTEHDYDGLNRLTETRRAGVLLVSNEYDANGNRTATIDAEEHRTGFTYTPRNLLDITTFADDTTQDRDYDGVGNLTLRHT